jgi:hypothetical protein
MVDAKIGHYAFILGVIIALVTGAAVGLAGVDVLGGAAGYVAAVLVVLGFVIGFLNIGQKQVNDFLIAAIALGAVGFANLTTIPLIGGLLATILSYVTAFVFPAALVVALKAVYALASKSSV